ncbi:MAG: hypothetical protein J6S26_05815 [Solobacterium sp.]|nr:hypothetical protein [Solobacterium sp.]
MERLAFLRQLASKYGHVPASFSSETTFSSMGMDSYDVVDFMLEAEEKFGITAGDEKLLAVERIGDVEEIINQCMQEDENNHA